MRHKSIDPALYALLALLLVFLSVPTHSYSVQFPMLALAIGLAVWSMIANAQRQKQEGTRRSSIGNIAAMLAILTAVSTGLHGPFGPELKSGAARAKLYREGNRLRQVGEALESYQREHGEYPAELTPFLTTPVSYLPTVPLDEFASGKSPHTYVHADGAWIVLSVGPDRQASDIWNAGVIPEPDVISHQTYDPTNGLASEGDLLVSRQGFLQQTRQRRREPREAFMERKGMNLDRVKGLVFTAPDTGEEYGTIRPREIGLSPEGFPIEKWTPIALDDCGNVFAFSRDGSIAFWDHETDEITVLADSFGTFASHCAEMDDVELDRSYP